MGEFFTRPDQPGQYFYQGDEGGISDAEVWKTPDGATHLRSSSGEIKELKPEVPAPVPPTDAALPPPFLGGVTAPTMSNLTSSIPPAAIPAAIPAAVAPSPSLSIGDVASGSMRNFGSSASQAADDFVQPFVHPIDTGKALWNLSKGLVQKAIPGVQDSEKYADAVGKFLSERYVGWENIKRTVMNDPAGVVLDVSMLLTGGGGLAARGPGVIGKAGKIAGHIGNTIDPVALAAKAGGAAIRGANRPALQTLLREGVAPTVGQVIGGGAKRFEDKAMSAPLLGNVIEKARMRANKDLNVAAYDRVLNMIDQTAEGLKPGAEGLAEVRDRLSAAYDKVLDQMTLRPDNQLTDDIFRIVDEVSADLSTDVAAQLERIVDNRVLKKIAQGDLPGPEIKIMQNDLSQLAARYSGSLMGSEKALGEALADIGQSFRDALARSNPDQAARLQKIDGAYARYARLRKAGAMAGADIEGFTPAQLRSAIKAADKSVDKGATATGRALMQDLGSAGVEVLGRNIPDSGTAGRLGAMDLLTGTALGVGSAFEPTTALSALAMVPYAPGVQRGLARALATRPAAARRAGDLMSTWGPRASRTAFQSGRLERELRRVNDGP